MARFVFHLDGLLRHRKFLERQKQRELAVVQKQVADLEGQLRSLNDSMRMVGDDLRQNRLVGRLDLNFLAAHRRFTIAMQRKGVEMMQRIVLARRQMEETRQALAEAAKQRKILEKLRERHHERWLAELNKSEMNQMDEIGMQIGYFNERLDAE